MVRLKLLLIQPRKLNVPDKLLYSKIILSKWIEAIKKNNQQSGGWKMEKLILGNGVVK